MPRFKYGITALAQGLGDSNLNGKKVMCISDGPHPESGTFEVIVVDTFRENTSPPLNTKFQILPANMVRVCLVPGCKVTTDLFRCSACMNTLYCGKVRYVLFPPSLPLINRPLTDPPESSAPPGG